MGWSSYEAKLRNDRRHTLKKGYRVVNPRRCPRCGGKVIYWVKRLGCCFECGVKANVSVEKANR